MTQTTVTIIENGPYKVQGPMSVFDHEGNEVRGAKDPVFLCRCGGSQKKPFCDGTHSSIGFQGAQAAVEQADNG
ncbi:MAG: CDGSH iron-sulfur domain-containing protein [Actinomycetota bacterium]|nr:CDGSH iron-sulfur domain-containing protein [Actinomycetota bacterium]